jgi:mannan endo-1,4-beta-mannosidase
MFLNFLKYCRKKIIKTFLLLIGITTFILVAASCQKEKIPDNSVKIKKQSILQLLTDISNSPDIIIGQGGINGNKDLYNEYIENLYIKTGKYVGLMGADLEYNTEITVSQTTNVNKILISHWKKGGLVAVSWSTHNPWNVIKQIEPIRDRTNVKMSDLVDPTTTAYKTWHTDLERIAGLLKQLQDSGVVVLWRPFHEMNGNFFWWGFSPTQTDFSNAWKEMYRYFMQVKGLNNLIWVYAPNKDWGDRKWMKPVDYFYPGDAYVDIVALDLYSNDFDNLLSPDYEVLLKYGKPLALAEAGPSGSYTGGQFDNMRYLNAKSKYPKFSYFMCWMDWNDVTVSIIRNANAPQLLNNEHAITADKLSLMRGSY